MNLPSSVIQKLDTCSGCVDGSARCSVGSTMTSPAAIARIAVQARGVKGASCLGTPPFECEQPLGPLLDEENDEDEHHDLREHGAGQRLEELGDRAEAERRDDRAGELADAASTTTMKLSTM